MGQPQYGTGQRNADIRPIGVDQPPCLIREIVASQDDRMPRTQRAEIADDAFDIIPDLQQHEAFARAGPAKMFRRERIRPAREIGIGKLFAFFPDQCNLLVKFIQPGGESHRSEEHTSELQSLMRISYAVFCLKKKKITITEHTLIYHNMNN